MEDVERLSVPEMEEFLQSNRKVRIGKVAVEQAYPLMERILVANRYDKGSKQKKGIIRRFLGKVTGRSRAQVDRLIRRWDQERKVVRKAAIRPKFPRVYTSADVALLAEVDAAHEDLSGPAARRLLERAVEVDGDQRYARLAKISIAHLYNLRNSAGYRRRRVKVEHTKPVKIAIADRRKPDPRDQPGYPRVDTVHQASTIPSPGSITSTRWTR